ncbi:MAG: mandelate racemase [Firmicutes bacterium]|nr:mandelate racemase [Bacillota bacterium]
MAKITAVDTFAVRLPMKQMFRIAGGVVGSRSEGAPHVYVRLTDADGGIGWGEARPSPRWSDETQESVVTTLRRYVAPVLLGQEANDLRSLWGAIHREIASGPTLGQPIAKAAVDTALHDLLGRQRRVSIGELWGGSRARQVHMSYLISTQEPDVAAAKARDAVAQGYRGVDVKIGLDPDRDQELLEAVRAEAPSLFFRVDANQGYNLPQALQVARHLARLGADVFEQPLPAACLADTAALRRKVQVPIALDEGIWSARDLLEAIRLEACDYAVIKLTKMGGLQPARLCGEIAKEANLGLLGGGLTESRLGLAASAHLFDYLEIRSPVDLNGPFFLADDPIRYGPDIQAGVVTLGDHPGVGCEMDQEKLKTFTVQEA